MPLVSVIIDNFNYARFLRRAIDSALAQTFEDREVIVVDDGSTDISRQIISDYNGRLVTVFKENGGQGSAFNAGLARASGQIVAFLDADDVWLPQRLARIVEEHQKHPNASVVYHRYLKVDADENVLDPAPWPRELIEPSDIHGRVRRAGGSWPCPPTSALSFSRAFLDRVMPAPEISVRTCADLYLATLGPFFGEVVGIDDVLMHYRLHGENAWHNSRRDPRDDLWRTELNTHTINQTLAEQGLKDRIRLDDNLPYRLLKYRLRADGSASLRSLIFHTLRWPGERLPIRLKMLLKNLRRAPKETSLPAVAWASRPR